MLAKVQSFALSGIEPYPVAIEVDVAWGLPAVTIVGMGDVAIRESKERVKSAIKNSGFDWPNERITVNLAPSNVKKEGSCFDLAIALGVMAATGQIDKDRLGQYYFLAELSLDGSLRHINGILPISAAISKKNTKNLVVSEDNGAEAAVAAGTKVYALKNLAQVVEFIHDPQFHQPLDIDLKKLFDGEQYYDIDFTDVKGQGAAKRATEVAVAGNHNILFIGPPGSGKSMIAKRIPTIMPALTMEEALEITKIHSVAGILQKKDALVNLRPFRSPHHGISNAALVGGGSNPMPGEISLAHNGILFLDELPEFRRDCLESLRQPLEDGLIRINRVSGAHVYPASFVLVAAMNPCPCGSLGNMRSACRCSTTQVYNYRSKLSGPLLDRIDIHIEIPQAQYHELNTDLPCENSLQIKQRIESARGIQRNRLGVENIKCNAHMNHKQIRKFCQIGKEENALLKKAMQELNFSARAYNKILKVSRTIADLACCERISAEHIAEAIQYRSLDRDFFT